MSRLRTVENSKGKCPKCAGKLLSFFIPEVEDGKVECGFECMDCGQRGTEWYTMHYNCTTWKEVKKDANDTA